MGLFLPGDDRATVVYDVEIAEKLGVNAAVVLSRIIWSLEKAMEADNRKHFRDGSWWMYDSVTNLQKYSALGRSKIKLVIEHLRNLGIIQTVQYEISKGKADNWYRVDGKKLAEILAAPPSGAKRTSGGIRAKPTNALVQNQPMDGSKTDQWGEQNRPVVGAKPTNLSISLLRDTENQTESQTKSPADVTPLPVKSRKPRARKPKEPIQYTAQELELGKAWLDYAIEELDGAKPHSSWNVEFFTEGVVKTMKATGHTLEEMWETLKYVRVKPETKTEFSWYSNATSPHQLLKVSPKNGKRKIQNIRSSMKNDNNQRRNAYERPKAVDLSADNGKFAKYTKDKPF
jgi:hypothetical protein